MGKVCIDCGGDFEPPRNNGYIKRCGPCNYEFYRLDKLWRKYGVTPGEYMAMYAEQDGRCAICGIHESELPKRLHLDHCHDTGRVRGLLCAKCNTSLGQFEKEPERLLRAYEYLTGGESDQ